MSYLVQNPKTFWDDLIWNVKQASNSVSIRVMEFEAGSQTEKLAAILKQKLKEGVKVTLFIDWVYSKYVHGEIDLLPILDAQKRSHNVAVRAKTRDIIEELKTAGASVSITNIPSRLQSLLPISGRNHTKIYIVDNVAWIGGVHPVDSAFESIDFMVKVESSGIVAALKEYTASKKNEIIPIDATTQLLFDGGKRGRSCIYAEAISSIEQAEEEIIFMSQFIPDGALLSSLIAKARQGIPVRIITSPKKAGAFVEFPANLLYKMYLTKAAREKHVQFIHCESGVHAKLLIIDRKKVLFGSHNFVSMGVWLGTGEVCIASQDRQLVKDLMQYIVESIPKSSHNFFS